MPYRIIPPGSLARVPDLHLVPEPGQVVGGGQPARPGADDQHPLAAARRRRVERPPPLKREIAEEPLDAVNRHRAVEAGAVADALARVVADPAVDRRHRIVADQLPPRPFVVACLGVGQPGLDVLPGRAARIARWQQVDVDGTLLAHRARAGPAVQQIRQRRNVLSLWSQGHIRHVTPGTCPASGTFGPDPHPRRSLIRAGVRRPVRARQEGLNRAFFDNRGFPWPRT